MRAPIFASLLVLTLLICHGALGNTDKLVLDTAPSVAMHQLQGEAGESGPAKESPTEHSPVHGYYMATLLTVMVGAFFWLLFRNTVATRRISVVFKQNRRNSALVISPHAPRLTPILLQVLRL